MQFYGIITNPKGEVKSMSCIITYQKENGEIFYRPAKTTYGKKVGDETSMGWKVLDIHYKYGNNYYCYSDYLRVYTKERKKLSQIIAGYLIKKLYKYR